MKRKNIWLSDNGLDIRLKARIFDIEFENIKKERQYKKELEAKNNKKININIKESLNKLANGFIDRVKYITGKMESAAEIAIDKAIEKSIELDNTKVNLDYNKLIKPAVVGMSLLVVTTLGLGAKSYIKSHTGYNVIYKDNKVLSIKDIGEFQKSVKDVEKYLTDNDTIIKRLEKPFSYEKTLISFENLADEDDIFEFVEENTDGYGYGYRVAIDGEELGIVENKNTIDNAIKSIISEIVPLEARNSTEIKEEITFDEIKVIDGTAKNTKDIETKLKENMENVKFHDVQAGDTITTISQDYEISYEELMKYNKDLSGKVLEPGDRVKLTEGPYITVRYQMLAAYEEKVEFDTEVIESKDVYTNKTFVKVEGASGKNMVHAVKYFENGKLISKEITSEEVLVEPTTKVIVKGTKPLPKYTASGSFLRPTRGRVTSLFGFRWGRSHKGIDIAGSYGTSIKAADSGKVIFSGWYYGLGKCIKIDHGNGFVTVYGHLSSLNASVGQKVMKGEHIGKMGSTGNSTGVHLHFEVLKNGIHQNPLSYLH